MMEDVTTIDTVNKRVIFAWSCQLPIGSFSIDTSVTDLLLKPLRIHEIYEQRKVSFYMYFGDNMVNVKTIRNGAISEKNSPMQSGYPMGGFEQDQYNDILKLHEKGLNAVVIAAIGYRAKEDLYQFAKKGRKPAAVLFEQI